MNKALSSFFSNSWCTRAWVQQEFAVSREVRFVCGRISLAPATIKCAVDAGYENTSNLYLLSSNTYHLYNLYRTRLIHRLNTEKDSLPSLLFDTFGNLSSSDPRD